MPTHADIEEMKYSYGNRVGWRRRAVEDFGDGGAFPEIPVAQYPLNMGRKASSSSIALAVQVNSEGQVDYIAIARQGTDDKQVIHAAFEDLIPLRQRVAVGDISLGRPSEDEVKAQTEKTKTALMWRVSGPAQGQNPRSRKPNADNRSANYVRYTLADQRKNGRIAKVVEKAKDPVDPPRHRIRKGRSSTAQPHPLPLIILCIGCQDNASPPAPIMHSPPRRLTAADREAWNIPHLVSNRKNPRGYTIPLDKRLAAAGLGLHDAQISDKFAYNAEAFFTAERHMREKIKERAQSQQKLEEREGTERETSAYAAERARQERQRSQPRDRNARIDSNTETEPAPSAFGSKDEDDEALRDPRQAQRERHRENDKAIREREQARRERFKENARHLRQCRMGPPGTRRQ
jgi:SNW domain-containing protein 1